MGYTWIDLHSSSWAESHPDIFTEGPVLVGLIRNRADVKLWHDRSIDHLKSSNCPGTIRCLGNSKRIAQKTAPHLIGNLAGNMNSYHRSYHRSMHHWSKSPGPQAPTSSSAPGVGIPSQPSRAAKSGGALKGTPGGKKTWESHGKAGLLMFNW